MALGRLILLAALGCADDPVRVVTPDGPVDGLNDGRTIRFLGIPFAEPPVDDLRFAAPIPIAPWTDPVDATAPAPACVQIAFESHRFAPGTSEDCLTLNVWAPAEGSGPFPVMVFLFGGAYVLGDAASEGYDGTRLSRAGDVVIVTANYRLGPFGFFALPAGDVTPRIPGNQALLDQQAALGWIEHNIGAFGGDPANVTLFGQSAGAGSTCLQLVSPSRADLFQAAILESPPCTAFPLITREAAETQGLDLADALGCTGDAATCLRDAPAADVLEALPFNEHLLFGDGVSWGPIADGGIVAAAPAVLLAAGAAVDIPIVVGSNADEGTLFFAEDGVVNTRDDLRDILLEVWDEPTADAILAVYPPSGDPQQDAVDLLSDLWTCDARRIARLHVEAGGAAWHYRFTRQTYAAYTGLGAVHGGELPFVFGNGFGALPVLPAGEPLTQAMQSYWTTFATDAEPDGPEPWPTYSPSRDESLRLDLRLDTVFHVEHSDCDAWDAILDAR